MGHIRLGVVICHFHPDLTVTRGLPSSTRMVALTCNAKLMDRRNLGIDETGQILLGARSLQCIRLP